MVRVHIIISGEVQGVGFRYFVKQKADELGLTGWVRNTPEGNVEAVLEGDERKINEVVASCKEGPPPAQVKDITVKRAEATGEFENFEITYS